MWKAADEDRYSPDLQVPKARVESGIMVWGCISAEGGLCFKILEGRQNSETYEKLLFEELLPAMDGKGKCTLRDYVFQQDNAAIHVSARMKEFFFREGIIVEDWPARSPDLNVIENLWSVMKSYITKHRPRSLLELRQLLRESFFVCANTEFCQKLYASIPRRYEAIIENSGARINY